MQAQKGTNMISFFRSSTSFKYIILFILFLSFRLPIIFWDMPWLNTSLSWLILGERLGQGYGLYTNAWDNTAPFAALFYTFLDISFGKSYIVHQMASILIIFSQALWLNQVLYRYQVYNERTMLPALLYLIVMSIFIDSWVVTPVLLANTFLIALLRYLLIQINEKQRYNATFEIGAYTAIATLFFLPSAVILLVAFASFLLYTNSKPRDYILMLVSFSFTIGIVFLGFYMFGAEYAFYNNFFRPLLFLQIKFYLPFYEILLLGSISILMVILNIVSASQYRRYSNYQNRMQTILTFWWIVSLPALFLDYKLSAHSLCFLAIPASFLLTHLFLQMQNGILRELLFVILISWHLFFTYITAFKIDLIIPLAQLGWQNIPIKISTKKLITQKNTKNEIWKNKKTLVIGDDLSPYIDAKPVTPYLNDMLSQQHWQNLDKYNVLLAIYDNFKKEIPEVIIDQKNTMKKVFEKLPIIAQMYQKLDNHYIYILKK